MIEVVAALIWDGDRFLICQRPENIARGLLWEYVGGKVEPGETKQEALIRECREELGVTISVGDVFMNVVHEYPDITVHLTLFHASIAEGTIRLLEHNAIAWITPTEIADYDFCQADKDINKRIMMKYKTYRFDAVIQKNPDMDAAYVIFPYDIREVFGKGRLKVHATFDGAPYDGSIVNMGVKDVDSRVCYVIGMTKAIRKKIGKSFGDTVMVTIRERE